jgi:hypothetical protein
VIDASTIAAALGLALLTLWIADAWRRSYVQPLRHWLTRQCHEARRNDRLAQQRATMDAIRDAEREARK